MRRIRHFRAVTSIVAQTVLRRRGISLKSRRRAAGLRLAEAEGMSVKRSVLAALLLLGACAPFGAKEADEHDEHETDEAPLSQGRDPAPALRDDADASVEEPESPEAGATPEAGTTDEPKKPNCKSVIGALFCLFD